PRSMDRGRLAALARSDTADHRARHCDGRFFPPHRAIAIRLRQWDTKQGEMAGYLLVPFQSGLPGTWMFAQPVDRSLEKLIRTSKAGLAVGAIPSTPPRLSNSSDQASDWYADGSFDD